MFKFGHVSKQYPDAGDALLDVSFHLQQGEMAFLMGSFRHRGMYIVSLNVYFIYDFHTIFISFSSVISLFQDNFLLNLYYN